PDEVAAANRAGRSARGQARSASTRLDQPGESDASVGGQEERGDDRFGGVLLYEVPAGGHGAEARAGDERRELAAVRDRQPAILLAPEHERWCVNLVVALLDLVGERSVELRDLTVEGGLARLSEPGVEIGA